METLYQHGLMLPAMVLVLWSLVVWAWMVATRIPAMAKAKLPPHEGAHTDDLARKLPPNIRAISDNYNHLMEQPTIFYAAAIIAQLASADDSVNIGLAWTYVTLRVLHTLIQNLGNNVMIRFYVFIASTLVLAALAGRTLMLMLGA